MKKILLAAAVTLAAIIPARADYYIRDGQGQLKLFKAGTLAGGVVLPYNSLTDSFGLPFGTLTNPVSTKFGTGVTLPDFTNPQHFICDSGCGGGGGGSSYTVTYGQPIGTLGTPTGFKDASGNFQSLLGDTTNGQWVNVKASVALPVTGTFWPYSLGQQVNASSVPVVLTATQFAALTPLSSVGISGTLPAYAATPTFNLGTLNGAATATNQTGGSQKTQIVDGSGNVIAATSNALNVAIVSGGGSGGTASAFGGAFPAQGTAAGMSQGGSMVALTGTSGNLNVQCANCSGSGASATDGAAFSAGTSVFAPSGGVFNDGLSAVTSGNQATARITNNRAVHMNLRTAAGVETGVAAAPLQVSLANTGANATAVKVDGSAVTQPISGTVTANAGTNLNTSLLAIESGGNLAQIVTDLGAPGSTACTTDTASCNQNQQMQRLAQRLTSVITALGSPFQAGGSIGNTSFGATQSGTWNITNISGTVSLPTGAATASNQTTAAAAKGQGATGAAVPSGAQYIGINSGGNLTGWNGAVTQSGTWTVQPGNTANTTAWLVTGTGGTFPSTQSGTWNITNVSGTVSLPTGASTAAKQPALGTAGSASSDVITVQGIASMTPLLVTLSGTNNINNISGTISLPTGAATAANQTSVIGTVAAGTAASNSLLTGAIFNSTPITVSNGQMAALQSDANGFLKVNVAAGGASGGTSSSFGAAFPGTGTAAGMSQGGNMVALTGTSGNLNVQCANCSGSGASATDATAFTAGASVFAPGGGFFQTTATNNALTNGQQGAWQMTANRAGFVNLRDTSGTAIGTSSAEVFVGGRGTAGSAAGGVLTVQGVASMTPLLTNPASATAPVSTMNSASAAAGVTAANAFVFDDVSPTAITENNFGYARMSANRNVYQTIRDAAGNERGANVDASNRLTTAPTLVSDSVASGAVASGAFASGSISSGAIAAGAQVDLLTMRGTKNGGTAATNSILAGLVYNATPLTLTDGQGASLQGDANGYLNVNVKTATGLAQGSTTSGQSGSLVMCAVTTSAPTYTTAQTSPLSCDTSGNLRISGGGGGGGAVTMASGAVASGAYSSGSIASGAFASGAVSSGAYASGSLASGAVVDITNLSTPIAPNTATATKGILNAGQYNSTQATFTNGQQGALQISSRGAQYVAVGADGFNVTNAGTFAVQIAANSSVNVAQINGVTPLMGNGATGTGSQRVTIANDSSAIGGKGEGATGATVPTGAVLAGAQSGANMVALIQASASAAINVSTATTTQLVALSGSTKIYVTSYDVIAGGTGNITFVYGTGSSCGTGTTSLTGAYNLTAQAGIAKGGGLGPVLVVPAGNALCVTTSAAVQMSGSIAYTQF